MLNDEIKDAIEKRGGRLLGKSDGLISNFTFETAGEVMSSYFELTKLYPEADFYTRNKRLLVYGITG